MNIPIKFPSEADVIVEEVKRFRSLSQEDRMQSIRNILETGALMMRLSPNADFLRKYDQDQEELGRQAVKEFIARHAGLKAVSDN